MAHMRLGKGAKKLWDAAVSMALEDGGQHEGGRSRPLPKAVMKGFTHVGIGGVPLVDGFERRDQESGKERHRRSPSIT
jgi:hypothetical protein